MNYTNKKRENGKFKFQQPSSSTFPYVRPSSVGVSTVINRDFKIQILQTTDYGWTWAYHIEGPGTTTEQTARKYEIKMADNRQQTAALRLLCPKCLSKKFDIRLSIAWQTIS